MLKYYSTEVSYIYFERAKEKLYFLLHSLDLSLIDMFKIVRDDQLWIS